MHMLIYNLASLARCAFHILGFEYRLLFASIAHFVLSTYDCWNIYIKHFWVYIFTFWVLNFYNFLIAYFTFWILYFSCHLFYIWIIVFFVGGHFEFLNSLYYTFCSDEELEERRAALELYLNCLLSKWTLILNTTLFEWWLNMN